MFNHFILGKIDTSKLTRKYLESKADALETYRNKYAGYFESLYEGSDDLTDINADYKSFQADVSEVQMMIDYLVSNVAPKRQETGDLVTVVKDLVDAQRESMQDFVKQMMDTRDEEKKPELGITKLPKLELKTFSGGYTQWTEFYDVFKCSVDRNDTLAKVQKLQYLKSCLKGEAANLIKACALNDENYDVAMNLLKSRYDNIKTIRDAHFDCIFQAQQLSTKSAAGIRRLISNINENVQALKNLKEKQRIGIQYLCSSQRRN